MANILVAGEERALRNLAAASLRLAGHSCTVCGTAAEALELAQQQPFDLLLLDEGLPGLDSPGARGRLPQDRPVLFITDRAAADGADDRIAKPFEGMELLARVEAVLRRTHHSSTEFRFHGLRIDLAARRVFCAEREVLLTPQEYALLEALVLHRNTALSREKLLQLAWGYDYEGETRTVDVHINRLRRKLGWKKEIQTVYKVGYRLSNKE